MSGCLYTDEEIADMDAQHAEVCAERDRLKLALRDAEADIAAHNGQCESLCGVGEFEGLKCGYRKYFPRRCPDCPRDWMIERAAPNASAPQES